MRFFFAFSVFEMCCLRCDKLPTTGIADST
jgi:hypothetical protein